MASVSVSATQSNSASVSQTSTATNNGAVSTTLANGSLSLYDPNDPLDFGNLSLINYQLTASSPVTTVDTNVMSHSGLNTGSLNNMGWIVPEDGSELQIGNLTGSGDITAVDGTVVIAGTGSTSETIGLVDNSNLYLGISPGMRFLSPIDIDSTSTIHFYTNPNGWASDLTSNDYNEMIGMTHPPADLIGGMAYVNSLTPGYQPEIIFQFASGPNGTTNYSNVTGVTIVDKPIVAAHT
jgi:hypothetical protein